MLDKRLTPILNVSNIQQTFGWLEKLGWNKAWEFSCCRERRDCRAAGPTRHRRATRREVVVRSAQRRRPRGDSTRGFRRFLYCGTPADIYGTTDGATRRGSTT